MKSFKNNFCGFRLAPFWTMPGVALLIAAFSGVSGAHEPTRIDLEMGASTVLKLKGVTRIAVGNSQIVQVTTVNPREVLVFGKTRGSTTVDIWISEKIDVPIVS